MYLVMLIHPSIEGKY